MNNVSSEYLKDLLETLKECLRVNNTNIVIYFQDVKSRVLQESPFKDRVTSNSYISFLEFLLDSVNAKWYRLLTVSQKKDTLDFFFLKCHVEESYVVLNRVISATGPSHKFDKALELMEEFLTGSAAQEMFLKQCTVLQDSLESELRNEVWSEVISYLVSLPDRIANKIPSKSISNLFHPAVYFKTIVNIVMHCFEEAHSRIQSSVDFSLQFLSRVVGRSCLAGNADVLSPLIDFLSKKTSNDYIWRRIAQKFFNNIPDNCIEVVYTYLMRNVTWYKLLSGLIGNAVLDNKRIMHLLTHKLLFIRCFDESLILQNIIGYLAEEKSRRELFIKVVLNLLEIWGNKSNLKHRPYIQHRYITKAIFIACGHVTEDEKKVYKNDIHERLVHGMDSHLSNPSIQIRNLGMVTAKCITKVVDPNGPQLEFEYEHNQDTQELETLLVPPPEPTVEMTSDLMSSFSSISVNETKVKEEGGAAEPKAKQQLSEDLDSDDDLEPYDLSNDTVVMKCKKPLYLRDCMEGLLEQEDPDRMEICLKSIENLIRGNPLGLEHFAVEVAKILLCLEDKFSTENFIQLRLNAMTAVSVACPKQVAEFFCEQFYERNYNLRQRLDILDVLVAAAQELSNPGKMSPDVQKTMVSTAHKHAVPTPENWKEILNKRIESKTRRFGKGSSKAPFEVINRFASCAGYFFFPLLNAYHGPKDGTLDLLGDDFLILGRLIYSLGTIVHAAINTPIVHRMGQSLLEFLWTVRYHTEPYVRKATIFSICMIVISVPSHFITGCLQDIILNYQEWLKETISKDLDHNCVQMASQALALIHTAIKENLDKFAADNALT